MLTQDRLKTVLDYNPETGIWIWKLHYFIRLVGERAGRRTTAGYRQIQIDGKLYYEHRLAFLYMLGRWPKEHVDHINGIKNKNEWTNLREATRTENQYNKSYAKKNKLKIKGVHLNINGKYVAQLRINKEVFVIGRFDTLEEATKAYELKAKEVHNNFYYER